MSAPSIDFVMQLGFRENAARSTHTLSLIGLRLIPFDTLSRRDRRSKGYRRLAQLQFAKKRYYKLVPLLGGFCSVNQP